MTDAAQSGPAVEVLRALEARGATLAVAESCTGGLIGHLLTEVPGASRSFVCDTVVYANAAKTALLGVPQPLLARFGAVSAQTARAMACGVRERGAASFGLATTGIAGPDGGTPAKPVGTVFIAVATQEGCLVRRHGLGDIGRSAFKRAVADLALAALLRSLAAPVDAEGHLAGQAADIR